MKLKRFQAPRFWQVSKKETKWAVSPRPGPHKKFESIPLQILIRNKLNLAETGKEAKTIIKRGEILVDGKPRKDHAYPAGLFDTIAIPKLKQFYHVVPDAKGLKLAKISEKESKTKIFKIESKTTVKKGRMQLNLHDGKNILADGKFKTGDSVLLEVPSMKIVQHFPLEQDAVGMIIAGADAGKIGRVKEIKAGKSTETKILCELEDREKEVLKGRFFVVGKDKPMISVE